MISIKLLVFLLLLIIKVNFYKSEIENKIKSISSGCHYNCIATSAGKVKCWGSNLYGELGIGNEYNKGDNNNEMGMNLPFTNLGSNVTAIRVSLACYAACALLSTKNLKCWGCNRGTIGQGHNKDVGFSLRQMGENLPIVNLGEGVYAEEYVVGRTHTCVLLSNKSVTCFGKNFYGQLGYGNIRERGENPDHMGLGLLPVNFGYGLIVLSLYSSSISDHTCVLFSIGKIKCWGLNNFGQLGMGDIHNRGDGPGEMGDSLPFVDLGSSSTPVKVALGGYHTCILFIDNFAKCFGRNNKGQLAVAEASGHIGDEPNEMGNNLKPMILGSGLFAQVLSLGDLHTCVLLNNNKVKCFGANSSGQLGYGDTLSRGYSQDTVGDNIGFVDFGTDYPISSIVSGKNHNCVVFDEKYIKCFGANEYGQLGYGDNRPRGISYVEMGVNLPFINLFDSENLITIKPTIFPSSAPYENLSENEQYFDFSTKILAIVILLVLVNLVFMISLAIYKIQKNQSKKYIAYISHSRSDSYPHVSELNQSLARILESKGVKNKNICCEFGATKSSKDTLKIIKGLPLLIIILSNDCFTKPWTLFEVYVALTFKIPIISIKITGIKYDPELVKDMLRNLTASKVDGHINASITIKDFESRKIDISQLGLDILYRLATGVEYTFNPLAEVSVRNEQLTLIVNSIEYFDQLPAFLRKKALEQKQMAHESKQANNPKVELARESDLDNPQNSSYLSIEEKGSTQIISQNQDQITMA